jgi:hypothetical protein
MIKIKPPDLINVKALEQCFLKPNSDTTKEIDKKIIINFLRKRYFLKTNRTIIKHIFNELSKFPENLNELSNNFSMTPKDFIQFLIFEFYDDILEYQQQFNKIIKSFQRKNKSGKKEKK